MNLDIRPLKVLDAVMATGSVTEAATQLHRTQPQVSRILKTLEEELGFELFQRLGRGLVPTRRGQIFHMHVRQLLDEAEALKRIAETVRRNGDGAVRIAAPAYFNQSFLPRIVASILASYPDLSFELVPLTRGPNGRLESGREFDVAIAPLPSHRPDLTATPLANVRFVAWLPAGHALAEKAALEPADFLGHPFIGIDWEPPLRDALRPFLQPVEQDLRIKVTTATVETAFQLVAAGVGIAIADPLVGAAYFSRSKFAVRPLASDVSYALGAYFPGSGKSPSPVLNSIALAFSQEAEPLGNHMDFLLHYPAEA